MLPENDGLSILKEIRQNVATKDVPVILITAKGSEMDKVRGLDMGADDYLTKPFSVLEMVSRVKALLRRASGSNMEDNILRYDDIEIDDAAREVRVKGELVALTYKEYELVKYLIRNHGIVVSRNKLLENVWGYDFAGGSRTVDMHIKSLRQKLGECAKHIITVRNVGYKLGE
jgi:two-component system alkaline phosphatase synthesis response regulator PhoP